MSALPAHVRQFIGMTRAQQLAHCEHLLTGTSSDYCESCGGDGFVECDNGPNPETETCEACNGSGYQEPTR